MPFQVQVSNILDFSGDAIVCPLYKYPRTAKDLEIMISRKADGAHWLRELKAKVLQRGKAFLTPSSGLHCSYIIYTKLPGCMEKDGVKLLRSCYRSVFALVAEHGLKKLALPLMGRGFPQGLALRVAQEEITDWPVSSVFVGENTKLNT